VFFSGYAWLATVSLCLAISLLFELNRRIPNQGVSVIGWGHEFNSVSRAGNSGGRMGNISFQQVAGSIATD